MNDRIIPKIQELEWMLHKIKDKPNKEVERKVILAQIKELEILFYNYEKKK